MCVLRSLPGVSRASLGKYLACVNLSFPAGDKGDIIMRFFFFWYYEI